MLIKNYNLNQIYFDYLEMAADGAAATVEKDADGIPSAWRVLKLGVNELTQNGERIDISMSAEDLDAIIDYHNEKGVKIPVDSNHYLKRFADKKGVDESVALAMVPGGKVAMAYGDLQKRGDGLWLDNVEFNPLAKEMMQEKMFKYYSPVIRGLAKGRLRVTSVALENEPSINNLDALAASADLRDDPPAFKQPTKEKKHMKLLCAALGVLLGMDSLSLSADGEAPEGVVSKIENLATEVSGLRESKTQHDDFMKSIKDGLTLGADADDNKVQGTILGLKAKADGADSLKTRVDTLELSAEDGKRKELIAAGRAEGKLVDAQLEWAKGLDCVALSAYLEKAPVVIPLGKINKDDLADKDSIALSAEDREVCTTMGISEEDFLKAKKV